MTKKTEIFRPSFIVPERVQPPIQLAPSLQNFSHTFDFTFFATDPGHVIKIYEAARSFNATPNGRLIFDNFWNETAIFASPNAGVSPPLEWRQVPIYSASLPDHLLAEKYVTFPSQQVWRFFPDTEIIHLELSGREELEIARMLASAGAQRYLLSKTGSRDPSVLVGSEFLDAYYRDMGKWLSCQVREEDWGERVFRDPRAKYNLVFENFLHQEVSRHINLERLVIQDGLIFKNKHITTIEDIGWDLAAILKRAEEIDNGFIKHPRGWSGSQYIIDAITKHEFLRSFFPAKKRLKSLLAQAETNLRSTVFANLWGMEEVFSPGVGQKMAPNTLGLIETRILGQRPLQPEKVVVSKPDQIMTFPEPTTKTSVVDFWEGISLPTKAEPLIKPLDIPGKEYIHTEIKFHVNHCVYGTSASVANEFFDTLEEFKKISSVSEILYREVMKDVRQGKVMLCAYPASFVINFDGHLMFAIDEAEVDGATALWKKCEVVKGVFIEGYSYTTNQLGTHVIIPTLDLSTVEGASDLGHELIHDLMDALFGRDGDLSPKLIPSFYKRLAKDYLRLEMRGGIMQLFTVSKPQETLIGIKDDFIRIADLDSSLAEQYTNVISEQKNHQDYLEMAEAHVFKRPRIYLKNHIVKFLKNHSRYLSPQLMKRGDKIITNSIRLDAVGLSGEDYLIKNLSILYSDIPVRYLQTVVRKAYDYLRMETIAHWGNVRLQKDYRSEDFDRLHISRFCENIIKQVPVDAPVAQYDSRNGADFWINAKLHSQFRLGVKFTKKTPLPLKKPLEYQGVVYRYYVEVPILNSGQSQGMKIPAKHIIFMPKSGRLFSTIEDTIMSFTDEPTFVLSQDSFKKIRQNMAQESTRSRDFFNTGFTAGIIGFQLGDAIREIARLDVPFSEKMTIAGLESRRQGFNICFYRAFGPWAPLSIAFFGVLGTTPYDLLQDTLYPVLSRQEQLDLDKAFFKEAAARIKFTCPDLRSQRGWEKWSKDLQKQSINVMQDVLRKKHPRYQERTIDTPKEEVFSWPRLLMAVLVPGYELFFRKAHADNLPALMPVIPPQTALRSPHSGSVNALSEVPVFHSNPQVALDAQRTLLVLSTPSQELQQYQITLPEASKASVVPVTKLETQATLKFPEYVDSKLLESAKSWYTPSSPLSEIKFGYSSFSSSLSEIKYGAMVPLVNSGGFTLLASTEAGKISTTLNITLAGANAASLSSLAVAVAALLKIIDSFQSGTLKKEIEKLEEHRERTGNDYVFIINNIVNPLQKMIASGEINNFTDTKILIGWINHLQEKIELVKSRKKLGIDLYNKLIKKAEKGPSFKKRWPQVKKLEKKKKEGVIEPCDKFTTECETFKSRIIDCKSAVEQKIILADKIKNVQNQISIAAEKGNLTQTLQQFNPEQKSIACQLLGKDLEDRLAHIHDIVAKAVEDKNYQAVFDKIAHRDHSLALKMLREAFLFDLVKTKKSDKERYDAYLEFIEKIPYATSMERYPDFIAVAKNRCMTLIDQEMFGEATSEVDKLISLTSKDREQANFGYANSGAEALQRALYPQVFAKNEQGNPLGLLESAQAISIYQSLSRQSYDRDLKCRLTHINEIVDQVLEGRNYQAVFDLTPAIDHSLALQVLDREFISRILSKLSHVEDVLNACKEYLEKIPYSTALAKSSYFNNLVKQHVLNLLAQSKVQEAQAQIESLTLLAEGRDKRQVDEMVSDEKGLSGLALLKKVSGQSISAVESQTVKIKTMLSEASKAHELAEKVQGLEKADRLIAYKLMADELGQRIYIIEEKISNALETGNYASFFETVSREDHHFALKRLKESFLLYLVKTKKTAEARHQAYQDFIQKIPYATGIELYPDFISITQDKCIGLANDLRFSEAIDEVNKLAVLAGKNKEQAHPASSGSSIEELQRALDPKGMSGNSLQLQLVEPAKATRLCESLSRKLHKGQLEYRNMIGKFITSLFFNTFGEDWLKESKGHSKFMIRTLKSTHLLAEEALPVLAQFLQAKLSGKDKPQVPQLLWEILGENYQLQNKNLTADQWLPVADQASALFSTGVSAALVWRDLESRSPVDQLLRKTVQFSQSIHLGTSALISANKLAQSGWQDLNIGMISPLINLGNTLFLQNWQYRHQQQNFQQLPESLIFHILQDNVTDLMAPLYFIIQLLKTPVSVRPPAWKLSLHQMGGMMLVRALTFLYRYGRGHYDDKQNSVRLSNLQTLLGADQRDLIRKKTTAISFLNKEYTQKDRKPVKKIKLFNFNFIFDELSRQCQLDSLLDHTRIILSDGEALMGEARLPVSMLTEYDMLLHRIDLLIQKKSQNFLEEIQIIYRIPEVNKLLKEEPVCSDDKAMPYLWRILQIIEYFLTHNEIFNAIAALNLVSWIMRSPQQNDMDLVRKLKSYQFLIILMELDHAETKQHSLSLVRGENSKKRIKNSNEILAITNLEKVDNMWTLTAQSRKISLRYLSYAPFILMLRHQHLLATCPNPEDKPQAYQQRIRKIELEEDILEHQLPLELVHSLFPQFTWINQSDEKSSFYSAHLHSDNFKVIEFVRHCDFVFDVFNRILQAQPSVKELVVTPLTMRIRPTTLEFHGATLSILIQLTTHQWMISQLMKALSIIENFNQTQLKCLTDKIEINDLLAHYSLIGLIAEAIIALKDNPIKLKYSVSTLMTEPSQALLIARDLNALSNPALLIDMDCKALTLKTHIGVALKNIFDRLYHYNYLNNPGFLRSSLLDITKIRQHSFYVVQLAIAVKILYTAGKLNRSNLDRLFADAEQAVAHAQTMIGPINAPEAESAGYQNFLLRYQALNYTIRLKWLPKSKMFAFQLAESKPSQISGLPHFHELYNIFYGLKKENSLVQIGHIEKISR